MPEENRCQFRLCVASSSSAGRRRCSPGDQNESSFVLPDESGGTRLTMTLYSLRRVLGGGADFLGCGNDGVRARSSELVQSDHQRKLSRRFHAQRRSFLSNRKRQAPAQCEGPRPPPGFRLGPRRGHARRLNKISLKLSRRRRCAPASGKKWRSRRRYKGCDQWRRPALHS